MTHPFKIWEEGMMIVLIVCVVLSLCGAERQSIGCCISLQHDRYCWRNDEFCAGMFVVCSSLSSSQLLKQTKKNGIPYSTSMIKSTGSQSYPWFYPHHCTFSSLRFLIIVYCLTCLHSSSTFLWMNQLKVFKWMKIRNLTLMCKSIS